MAGRVKRGEHAGKGFSDRFAPAVFAPVHPNPVRGEAGGCAHGIVRVDAIGVAHHQLGDGVLRDDFAKGRVLGHAWAGARGPR